MKRLLTIVFILLALPAYAEWSDYGLTLVASGTSSQEGAVKFELKDAAGRVFYLNSPKEPDAAVIGRIVKYKDGFFGWKHSGIKELSFYMYQDGLQAVIVPSSVTYMGTDLKPYLPSDFTFIEGKKGMDYRYRIIVGSTSLKLYGAYTGEEPMLDEMLAYINGIKGGKIVVEDEKVVSGSVVSFSSEKNQGDKQVHPVGDLAELNSAGGRYGKLKLYASAQGSYLYPVSFLGDVFLGGYGATASVGLRDMGFSLLDRPLFRFDLEFTTGFWKLDQKDQRDDNARTTVNNAFVVPLELTARYRVGITQDFSVSPSIGFGYFYNRLQYDMRTMGTVESVTAREWNPAMMPGLRCDYRFDTFCIFAGAEYLVMFERRLDLAALVFSMGCGYFF